jgi:ABC-type multidrug transport system fused ATPase/permease subunit
MSRGARTIVARELGVRRRALGWLAFWSMVQALPAVLSGLLIGAAIDHFLRADRAAGLGFLGALLIATAIGAVGTRRLFKWLAATIDPVRDALLGAVVEGAVMAATEAGSRPDASAVAGLTLQVQSVRGILTALLRTGRSLVVTLVGVFVGLGVMAPAAAVIVGGPVVVASLLFVLLVPRLAKRFRSALLAGEETARRTGEVLHGARDVIACGTEAWAVATVGDAIREEAARDIALARATSLRRLLVFIGGQVPLAVLLGASPWLLRQRYLTVGELVGTAAYLTGSLIPAFRMLLDVTGTWGLELILTLDRLGQRFALPEPAETGRVPAPVRFDLEVSGLTFAYGPQSVPVVRELTFGVPAGDHLALVGPSGIGKSTVAALLAGLVTPQSGLVRIGGVDLRRIRRTDLRQLLGLIPQEAYVFAGTLRENLTYLAPGASNRHLDDAVAEVGLGPVLDRLGGYQALVGAEGATLSGGEKQLVALTRMYLSPARVVVLDEATSQLDPIAEARAENAFARRDRTTLIVIAHRISSAQRARRILLLDGDLAVLGTHQELVTKSAAYSDLVGHWAGSAPLIKEFR